MLNVLQRLHAPGAQVMFRDWEWDRAWADTLIPTLPSLSARGLHVSVEFKDHGLTDGELGLVLAMGPHMRHLRVSESMGKDHPS
jgi:hypothetical protein